MPEQINTMNPSPTNPPARDDGALPPSLADVSTSLDRRAFMRKAAVATTAVAAVGSVAVASDSEPDDSAIFALAAEFEEAHRAMKAYEPIHTAAEERYIALWPTMPERPKMPTDISRLHDGVTLCEFSSVHCDPNHPIGRWHQSSEAAHDEAMARYEEAKAEAARESGWDEADAVYVARARRASTLANRLTDERAHTLPGLLTKGRVVLKWNEGFTSPDLAEAMVKDIQGIVERAHG